MASVQQLPEKVLEAIAEQIGMRLSESAERAIASGEPLELGESFPIWMIGLSSLMEEAIEASAVHTGYWHHQIRHGQRVAEFAKSRPLGPGTADWRVEEVVESPIAEKVDRAIQWIDDTVHEDEPVRLLVIPAYFVHAFWIGRGWDSRLLLIDAPHSLGDLGHDRLYSWPEFRHILLQQPHVVGIPPQEPAR
jgi:hypothetical protein